MPAGRSQNARASPRRQRRHGATCRGLRQHRLVENRRQSRGEGRQSPKGEILPVGQGRPTQRLQRRDSGTSASTTACRRISRQGIPRIPRHATQGTPAGHGQIPPGGPDGLSVAPAQEFRTYHGVCQPRSTGYAHSELNVAHRREGQCQQPQHWFQTESEHRLNQNE